MKKIRIVGLLLVLVLITSSFVGGTFAKYTSTATGSDDAIVAVWSIFVNDAQIAVKPEIDNVKFDLFATINEEDTTTAEDDVAGGNSIIAPGTGGKFELVVKNLSQVTAEYTITLAHDNESNIPIEYSVDGSYWTSDIASIKITKDTKVDDKNPLKWEQTSTETVYWRWSFNNVPDLKDDNTDTDLGITARTAPPTVKVTATITVEQVD